MKVCIVSESSENFKDWRSFQNRYYLVEITKLDYPFTLELIQSFDVVIFLNGTVNQVYIVASMMQTSQLLVYTVDQDSNNSSLIEALPVISVGLRLGTSDILRMTMLQSALSTGYIHVENPHRSMAILNQEDFVNCLQLIIDKKDSIELSTVYDLVSYHTTPLITASNIALKTGAKIIHNDNPGEISGDSPFDNSRFIRDFNYTFSDSTNNHLTKINSVNIDIVDDERSNFIFDAVQRFREDGHKIIAFGAQDEFYQTSETSIELRPDYLVHGKCYFIRDDGLQIVPLHGFVNEVSSVAIMVSQFSEKIEGRIIESRKSVSALTIVLVCSEHPVILVLNAGVFIKVSEHIIQQPKLAKSKTLLISHFFNEEFLLPYWIMHHAPMFDEVILINYSSTDSSVELIKKLAPKHWRIVDSRNEFFDAVACDDEVFDVGKMYPDDIWKIALTTTEFIVWPDMKKDLDLTPEDISCYRLHNVAMVGDDSVPLNPNLPLVQQRCKYGERQTYDRFIHRYTNHLSKYYSPGRHFVHGPSVSAMNAMLFKYLYTPWPESLERKLQIGARQPEKDIIKGFGYHHQYSKEKIEELHNSAQQYASADTYYEGMYGSDMLDHLNRSRILHQHLSLPWSSM